MNGNLTNLSSRLLAAILAAMVLPMHAMAGVTDLADEPLSTQSSSSTAVKPNIAFVVDDSGSMNWESMPADDDYYDVYGTTHERDKRCFGSYQHNTLFYNPNVTYKPPYKPDGAVYTADGVTRYPDAKFTSALFDGYFDNGQPMFTTSRRVNNVVVKNSAADLSRLSNLTPAATTCTVPNPSRGVTGEPGCTSSPIKYYYSAPKTSTTSKACLDNSSYSIITDAAQIAAPGVATGSDAAKTNYANWYSYYRFRAALMKAAAAEAFKDVDQGKYRVGLFFINSAEATGDSNKPNHDLQITDFSGSTSGTQRFSWYEKLYQHREGGGTPLRGSLSRMGRMYAGKVSGWDPVQYSCQQNFTILSTDGYWNDSTNDSYGPKALDGTTNVGNTDPGPTQAVAATTTLTVTGPFGTSRQSDGCYKLPSLTVNGVELLDTTKNTSIVNKCYTGKDNIGAAIAKSINDKTSTGYTAVNNNGRVTITAPLSAGNTTVTPTLGTPVQVSGQKTYNFSIDGAFGNYQAATTGFPAPFKDNLNVSNTLADVAHYYYNTDLRTNTNCSNTISGTTYDDLCTNNVKGSGDDKISQQHMTTYTIGLGVSGTITYQSDYKNAPDITTPPTNTYWDIVNNGLDWPNPTLTNADLNKIDDLWHAAVNGHGIYYSASESSTLKQGIQSALEGIKSQKGSAAAAATSNLEPVAGDNFVYLALYQTVDWYGDLQSYTIDPQDGTLSNSGGWSANERLDTMVANAGADADGRTILYLTSDARETDKLKDFSYSNLNAEGLLGYFQNICSKTPAIDQCGNDGDDLNSTKKDVANNAANLIAYLRGQHQFEDESSNPSGNRVYRNRLHVLGDIVNAVPVYEKKPPFSYGTFDSTYDSFKTAKADRAATVFVAANDGMLHAINATTGDERWAYVPKFSMSNMWTLADRAYGNHHRYFVDGSPTLADVCDSPSTDNVDVCGGDTHWKTIIVGGLNKGGCGYYALDVTDPANPKGLWEFTDANLGYAYGNPIVVRNKQGKWVVIFSSGYNNYPDNGCGSNGDGNGHVYVLDALTGQPVDTDNVTIPTYISGTTPAGTPSNPSGLGKLNAWVENISRPVADRVYGGDLLGNVWRIDFDDNHSPSGNEAKLLATLKDGTSDQNPQPITVKPSLAEVRYGGVAYPVVFVGTGKFLGVNDKSDTSRQSIYALKDSFSTISDVRGTTMKPRTLTETTGSTGTTYAGRTIRTVSGSTVDWANDDGWYIDLNPDGASPGERVNVDMSLQYNMLTVAANVPEESACTSGGYGFLYFLDIATGKNLPAAVDGMAGVKLSGNALVAGFKTVKLTSGKTVTLCTDTSGNLCVEQTPDPGGGAGGSVKRTTWREIED